ncbi:TetR/AcrR family transcriptional regulator [Flexibacterium corallicola]|uniref:TetR/AcrR family transcriptional regulator n=1 Tax=Flexibacterium corallicola TaxID=3037259 RepID=UPI00286ECC24|nr:TetR/AcrR family transcriptional regulator [Pseudovibrio sp. M1P-2-3]
MMRSSKEEAALNRERVVKIASEKFREYGYDGIGIAGLMKSSGLTNGAFYKQFTNKEALIAEATDYAFKSKIQGWSRPKNKNVEDPKKAIAQWYLNEKHIEHVELGCAIAALAAEAPRHGSEVQTVFTKNIKAIVEAISQSLNQDGDGEAEAIKILATLVGALVLARATDDKELSQRVVDAVRR